MSRRPARLVFAVDVVAPITFFTLPHKPSTFSATHAGNVVQGAARLAQPGAWCQHYLLVVIALCQYGE